VIALWLRAFLLTQLVEIPIYRRALGCGYLAAFGASAITHPLVWLGVVYRLGGLSYLQLAILAELFAWLTEGAYFTFLLKKRRGFLWALVANAASVLVGWLSHRWFGVP
jgi:hypothetical protein